MKKAWKKELKALLKEFDQIWYPSEDSRKKFLDFISKKSPKQKMKLLENGQKAGKQPKIS